MTDGLAGLCLRAASLLVPRYRRDEWLEEWRSELAALEEARTRARPGLPSPLAFALGSLPHAFWIRMNRFSPDSIAQDLKYAARLLRRSPGFTAVAVLTLALGIGANAAIFSLVNGLVLRAPAGVEQPERLVQIARSYESAPRWDNFSWPAMELIATERRAFSGVAGHQTQPIVMGRGRETQRVLGEVVTGNYFELLGVRPHVGRLIQPADGIEPGGHAVAVLSHELWSTRFGGDPAVVGQTIPIGALPYEIIGVAPPGFAGIESVGSPPEIWVPAMQIGLLVGREPFDRWGTSWINVVGRLADGVDLEAAESYMDVVSTRLRDADAGNEDMVVLLEAGVGLDPEGRRQARQISGILLAIVALVLLITCTNVANLFLARASARRGEVAVRMALGAGRSRLVRQLMTESVVLALLGTALAIPVIARIGDLLPAIFPYALSVSLEADARVYAFLIAIGLAAGLLFGIAPAWATARSDAADPLREGASTGGRRKTRLRDLLVVAQLGLSLALVSGTALLGRSILNVSRADPGFEPQGLITGVVDLQPTGRYDEPAGRELYRRLLAGAQSMPGARSATLANQMPIAGGHARRSVAPMGRDDVFFEAEYIVVGPDYFETMGIPILEGRGLGGFDDEPEPVVVVNEALADLFWPGEDPIGQELDSDPVWRVVGVVGDVQMRSLRSPGQPAVYYPLAHEFSSWMTVHVAGLPGASPSPDALRDVVADADPELPVSRVYDLEAALAESMGETRTIGLLVGVFAALALILAAIGLYGLVSYGASQRVRELGIRTALGARPGSLVRLVLARGIAIALLGIVFGFVVSMGLAQALESLLFGVAPSSVGAFTAAAAVLLLAAGFAAWVPARRASRVDAAASLREA